MSWNQEEPTIESLNKNLLFLFYRRLWPYIRPYRGLFAWSVFLILISTAASIAVPWCLGYAVDHFLTPQKYAYLVAAAFCILWIDVVSAASTYWQSYSFMLLGQRILQDLRRDLLKQYQFYPLKEYYSTPAGRLVTRLVNDTSNLQDLFTSGLAIAFGNISIVVGIISWMILVNPFLGCVCISVFPIMVFASRQFGRLIRKVAHESRAALAKLNGFLAENISGMGIIQLFNRENIFFQRFSRVSSEYTATQIKTIRSFAYFQPTITVLSSLSMCMLIWFGGSLAVHQNVTMGVLIAFMSYLHALYSPVRDITEKYNLFLTAMTSCERIFEFMDRLSEGHIFPDKKTAPFLALKGDIQFENVYFKYSTETSGKWILKDLNFRIKPGEKIGIVGHTGAGKTTLAYLLMRFFDVSKGRILLDGRDVMSVADKRSLRRQMGYIQQEPFIFSGTVAENIFLWDEGRKDVYEKLPAFVREPFETGLLKLDRVLLEKGANLSLGEKQILAFMRSIIHDPQILILDEATAHMDSMTERWIGRVSTEIFKNKTMLVIAHRLATLKTVDRILVLHHGELVETGNHQELLKHKGIYHRLYEIQFRKEHLEHEQPVQLLKEK